MDEKKLKRPDYLPLRDVVFIKLREAILKGELLPGSRLMELPISKQLKVSRTPVREAIKRLEQEGLAVIYPGRGARVAQMTPKDLDDVLQIRAALDALAVRLSCDQRTSEDLSAIHDAMKKFEEATKTGDLTLIAQADENFHDRIYDSTDNDKFKRIIKDIREQMFRFRFEYIKDTDAYPRLIREHREIYEGLKDQNKDIVELAIQVHIAGQRKRVLDAIKRQ